MRQGSNFESGAGAEGDWSTPKGLDEASTLLLKEIRHLPSPEELSIDEVRLQMLEGQVATVDRPALRKQTLSCSGCEVFIFRNRNLEGLCPPVFFLHGGGWLMGDVQTHAYLIGELAERSDCAIVFIEYPRAPQAKFPQNLEAAFSVICDVLADAVQHEIDATRFGVAGDSAGGNMATALVARFQQERQHRPNLQVLFYPALNARIKSATYRTFGKGLNLTERTMRWFWHHYKSKEQSSDDPLFSPACADDATLRQMPETLIITSEFDVLRDEGEDYAVRLRQAGVDVCSVRFGGVLHGFMVAEPLAKSASGDLAIQLAADYLRKRLRPIG